MMTKKIPQWLAESAVYQINPRTFSAAGTIQAVTEELPFLAKLGFGIMYLCPVFREDASEDKANWSERQKKSQTGNPKNPYRISNYFEIDEEYGTIADLKNFIQQAHRLGMHVLLDLVYAHLAPNSDILKVYPQFAQHDETGKIRYSLWHFPLTNFACAGLREYLWSNMTYYVGEIGADGFRCDVGDMVPLDFWLEGRRRIQAIKPDAVLINEGSNWEYLVEGFDASYCFQWHEDLYQMLSHSISAAVMQSREEERKTLLPAGARLLRDLDNHDTVTDWPQRSERLAGHDGMEAALALNYLIDGIPMVYCGNELADTAHLSMFANRFHMGEFEVTNRAQKESDAAIRRIERISTLNALRKKYKSISYGQTEWISSTSSSSVIAFKRQYEGESLFFAVNFGTDCVSLSLDGQEAKTILFYHQAECLDFREVTLFPNGYILILLK